MRVPADRVIVPLFRKPGGRRLRSLILALLVATLLPEAVPGDFGATAPAEAATRTRSVKKTARPHARTARHRVRSQSRRSGRSLSYRRAARRRLVRGRRGRRVRRIRAERLYGSRAALIIDARTGEVLFEKNAASVLPVASITKLMTNIVFLESDPDMNRAVAVDRGDIAGAGKTQLRTGEVITVHDLLYHSLMSSDNAATRALVRSSGIPAGEYLARMNRKASVLGLHGTRFVEFTGLDPRNTSSAADVAQMLKYASNLPMVARITSQPEYTYRSSKREHHLVNTNRLARYGLFEVRSGKTGFIQSAGYCLVTWVREGSRDLIAVVLGAPSNPARFNEARRLLAQAIAREPAAAGPGLPAAVVGPQVR